MTTAQTCTLPNEIPNRIGNNGWTTNRSYMWLKVKHKLYVYPGLDDIFLIKCGQVFENDDIIDTISLVDT